MPIDHYKTLGVSKDATPDEIKKAWKTKVRQNHPDQNQDDSGAEKRLIAINEAHDTLKDAQKKAAYDGHSHQKPETASRGNSHGHQRRSQQDRGSTKPGFNEPSRDTGSSPCMQGGVKAVTKSPSQPHGKPCRVTNDALTGYNEAKTASQPPQSGNRLSLRM